MMMSRINHLLFNIIFNVTPRSTDLSNFEADRTAFTDLNLYWIKGALALFVLVSGYVC